MNADSIANIVRGSHVGASEMQTELSKGTLVWVTPRIGEAKTSRDMVKKHGNLWVVDGIAMRGDGPKPAWYWCKSLSNGYVYDFRADEIEVKEQVNG